jgi:hypothetical protein
MGATVDWDARLKFLAVYRTCYYLLGAVVMSAALSGNIPKFFAMNCMLFEVLSFTVLEKVCQKDGPRLDQMVHHIGAMLVYGILPFCAESMTTATIAMIQASWLGNGPAFLLSILYSLRPIAALELLHVAVHINAIYQFTFKAGAVMLNHGSQVVADITHYSAADAVIIVLGVAFYLLFSFWTHQEARDLCGRISSLMKTKSK